MSYTAFHDYFPAIAERETRTLTVFESNQWGAPAAQYSLIELFCDEPGCDCRRVMFNVFSSKVKNLAAVIAYGWESEKFYTKWIGQKLNPKMMKELKGPALNAWSPQSKIAPLVLKMVMETVLQDQDYVERVKRHYRIFRELIENEAKIQRPDVSPIARLERTLSNESAITKESIGRNVPCPCGSGKKYKKCCGK